MSHIESLQRHAAIKAKNVGILAKKVIEELEQPRQLLNLKRAVELFRGGVAHLNGIAQPISDDTIKVQAELENNLHITWINGDACYVADNMPIEAVVFSPGFRVFYYHTSREDHRSMPEDTVRWYITPPTRMFGPTNDRVLPELGFQDNEGIKVEFQEKSGKQFESFGGFFIDNEKGLLIPLNYYELSSMKSSNLDQNQVLMAANWYIDSDNQSDVAQYETGLGDFNGIGQLINSKTASSYIFALNSGGPSNSQMRVRLGLPSITRYPISKRTVAAMCNLMAQKYNCDSWKICGLEYTGGGARMQDNRDRDFFRVY